MKKINSCCEALFLFCLLSVIVAPAYGQTAGSRQADNDYDEIRFYFSGLLNYNSSCDEKKIGAGAGLEMEWQFKTVTGVGLGIGYSSDAAFYEGGRPSTIIMPPRIRNKKDFKLSMINVPLRLYLHAQEWLTFDIGLQWSCITGNTSGKEIYHSCLSLPLGVSIGSTHHLFVRYQPCLNKLLKGDDDGKMNSNLLLFGVGIRLF